MKNLSVTLFITLLCAVSIFLIHRLYSEPSKYEGKIVRKIDFYGLKNVEIDDLLYIMKTTEGYPLRSYEVRQDIRDIFKKGNFESVKVEIEEYTDGVRLRFVCKERPVIKEIEFKGYEEVSETDLTSAILLKEGDVLRKDYIEKSVKKIKDKYEKEGLFNSVVTYKITTIKDDENQVKIVFIIDEGEEIKVHKISILGAKKVYSKELQSIMETSEDGFFKDGTFKKDEYEQDKSKIIGYYRELGYLDAEIIEDSVEYEWVDPEKKEKRGIFITIKVSEGDRYYFDKYTVAINGKEGTTVFTPKEIMEDFELNKSGEIFNDTTFQKDRQMISFNYASKGYIFARVIPKRTVVEKEVTVDGKAEKRKFVTIDFVIDEGTQAYIDMIIIKGNKKTKDKVIRRELVVKEGELFDSRKMQVSREKVYNLGFFKQVNIDVRPGSREGYMNLIIDVEEQPTGTISLGGGYGTSTGFSIFADIAENNLLGNGQRVGLKFEYGPKRNSITLSFYERWLFDYPVGFSASIFYQLYTVEANNIFLNATEKAEYEKEAYGYSLGLSYRFAYHYTVGTNWSHAFKRIKDTGGTNADEVFNAQALGIQQNRTLTFFISRDSRDNYMNPTSGWVAGMSMAMTGGRILGGGDHYIKYEPEFSVYYSPFHLPFLKSHPCVIEFRTNGTFTTPPWGRKGLVKSQPYTKNEWLEFEDRLHLGGPETIRGWDLDDSKFADSWKKGLYHRVLYGLEFRVPIHPQMLWTAFFFDAASLWSDKFWERQLYNPFIDQSAVYQSFYQIINQDLAAHRVQRIDRFFQVNKFAYFKYSYGFGFRVQIPMMPLRFWFGRKLVYHKGFKSMGGLNFQFGIGDVRF